MNTNKPLINQIFTAAHEYYHYMKDYQKFKEMPYVCDFSMLKDVNELDFARMASMIMVLTVKYQMPLKAVIYRLAEEHYIDSVEKYIENYEFIKKVLQKIKIWGTRVDELYGRENNYVFPYSAIYQDMERDFTTGNASREDVLKDAEKLNLDMGLIEELLILQNNT